jgi:FKBP-type peptidyl-prolyl cis-trans isomerase FklB
MSIPSSLPRLAAACMLSLTASAAWAADPAPGTVTAFTGPGAGQAVASVSDSWTLQQKASYLVGQQMAEAIKHYNLDVALVTQAIGDAVANKPSAIPPSQSEQILQQYQQMVQESEAKKGAERKETNAQWLSANGKKPGVTTTASGLQYQVISSGTGKQPTASDTVSVNYRGTLIDGTEFDASAKHGGPATFQVGGVIKGWTEALQLMHEGDKWRLFIPSDLAYGEQGPPGIGSNQVLIFDVELVKVLDSAGAAAAGAGK